MLGVNYWRQWWCRLWVVKGGGVEEGYFSSWGLVSGNHFSKRKWKTILVSKFFFNFFEYSGKPFL